MLRARYTCLFLLSSFCIPAKSQSVYSLQDILAISNKSSTRMQIIDNSVQSDLQQVRSYRSEAFPKIDFSTSIAYGSQTLQSEFSAPGDIATVFDRIDGILHSWSLTVEQPLFKFGQIYNAFKLASLSKSLTQTRSQFERNTYFVEVIEQFIQTYINQFDYDIATQSLDRAQRVLQRVSRDFDVGRVSKRDYLRTEASFEADKAQFISSKTNRDLSKRRLSTLIGLPDSIQYSLTVDTNGAFLQIPSGSKEQNPQVVIKKLQFDLNKYLRRNAWSAFFPTINFVGSLYNDFMAVDTSGLTQRLIELGGPEAAPVTDIPVSGDYFNPDFINYSVGLQLNWNIFDGTRNWAQYRQAKIQEQTTSLELEQLQREITNTLDELKSQISSIDTVISAYQLQHAASLKALQQADLDFQNGFIDAVTFIEIETEFNNALRTLQNARLQKILLAAQLRVSLGLNIYE